MRKLLYVVLGLFSLASVYIFIPQQIIVSEVEDVETSERIIAKYLNSNENRHNWWPSVGHTQNTIASDDPVLEFGGYKFDFKNPDYNFNEVLISNDNLNINSIITWELSSKNLIRIRWKAVIPTSYNPITRVVQYTQAHKLKAQMALVMERLLTFIVNSKNVYGINFERRTVKDTILATTTTTSIFYPKTSDVYRRINSVQKYLQEQGARQVNPPMLNISQNEQGKYQTVIALPIHKVIQPSTGILITRMVAGNILVAEIKGGPRMIAEGFNQMDIYLKDFKLASPAMPFESLINDRLAEPDTSKWITKIYYPIF